MEVFNENLLIDLLKAEVRPAVGCTEPVAVALNAAAARENLGSDFNFTKNTRIKVEVSKSIYRNGLDVGIPNSDIVGLDRAASLGLAIGDTSRGLLLLSDLSQDKREECEFIYKEIRPEIIISDCDSPVYIKTTIIDGNRESTATSKLRHDNIVARSLDGKELLVEEKLVEEEKQDFSQVYDLDILDIIEAVERLDYKDLAFLKEGLEMNMKAAKMGVREKYELGVGYSYYKNIEKGRICKDLNNLAYAYTAAASDVRMSGEFIEIMSLGGSGNNGITASIPIYVYSDLYDIDEESLLKALAISYILTLYGKGYIGRLSNLCGCSLAASIGVTAAITWLMGDKKQIGGAINNIIGNLSGVICDGAKGSCSLKLGTAASSSIQSALLAIEDSAMDVDNGIVNKKVERSLENLSLLSKQGMKDTDDTIIDIMKNR